MAAKRKRKEPAAVAPSKKQRYELVGEVTISVSTIVWARSEAEARRIGKDRGTTSGLVDRGNEVSEWVTGDELDGEVTVVECVLADDDGSEEEDES